jgi:predicted ATPase
LPGWLEVITALEEASQASFITAVQAMTYQFNHPLLQEAIYNTLTFSQRQRWHSQLGDWLIEGQTDAEQNLELIAYHYLQGVDVAKAAWFGRQAGDRARERGAYAGAAEYYAKVLALTTASPEDRMAAAEGQADVLALQGNYQAAQAAYTQAMGWGSPDAAGKQAILSGEIDSLLRTAFTPALRPWADGARAWLLAQQGQREAAAELVRAALAVAEETAQPALETLAQALTVQEPLGRYDEWLGQFTRTVLMQPASLAHLSRV